MNILIKHPQILIPTRNSTELFDWNWKTICYEKCKFVNSVYDELKFLIQESLKCITIGDYACIYGVRHKLFCAIIFDKNFHITDRIKTNFGDCFENSVATIVGDFVNIFEIKEGKFVVLTTTFLGCAKAWRIIAQPEGFFVNKCFERKDYFFNRSGNLTTNKLYKFTTQYIDSRKIGNSNCFRKYGLNGLNIEYLQNEVFFTPLNGLAFLPVWISTNENETICKVIQNFIETDIGRGPCSIVSNYI